MKKLLFSLLLIAPLVASAWDNKEMNNTVDETNFIVDSRCSGTLVSLKHRLILTANHCVDHKVKTYMEEEVVDGVLTEVKKQRLLDLPVTQKHYNGSKLVGSAEYMTQIVGRAEKKDLALLQIRQTAIKHSKESKFLPADQELSRGETVWSVGNPSMLDASVSRGVISSLTRMFRVPWANNEEIPFIQYDALGAPGSSGGALYNDNGDLIGVIVAGHIGVPIGYVVHFDTVREFLDDSCYPVYEGGMLAGHCKDFGEVKEEEPKPTGGSSCGECSAEAVQRFWMEQQGIIEE